MKFSSEWSMIQQCNVVGCFRLSVNGLMARESFSYCSLLAEILKVWTGDSPLQIIEVEISVYLKLSLEHPKYAQRHSSLEIDLAIKGTKFSIADY
ncbi:hypothetical protein AVEN_73067-1 [Araneus ventricosus]|uniref:Uncharacterized protein n=1 Tax=Araneus ventricosus TaxID=182803 RepID=A0A4Y2SYM0_ARAVE|nr:hypothetical protein AVEN_73067-1 [Araneus ventricosus]